MGILELALFFCFSALSCPGAAKAADTTPSTSSGSIQYQQSSIRHFNWGKVPLGSENDPKRLEFCETLAYDTVRIDGTIRALPGPIRSGPDGEVVIEDNWNRRMLKVDSKGKSLGIFECAGISQLFGIDLRGYVYIATGGTTLDMGGPGDWECRLAVDEKFKKGASLRLPKSQGRYTKLSRLFWDDKGKMIGLDTSNWDEAKFYYLDLPEGFDWEKARHSPALSLHQSKDFKSGPFFRDLDGPAYPRHTEKRFELNLPFQPRRVLQLPPALVNIDEWHFISTDQKEWAYILSRTREDNSRSTPVIACFDLTGKCVATLKLATDESGVYFEDQHQNIDVGRDGTLYQLNIQKGGAELLKWTPKN